MQANAPSEHRAKLSIRQARAEDVRHLVALTARVYSAEWGHSAEMLQGQQTHFPEGQFVAEYEGQLVGYCATFRIDEATALAAHTWAEITGNGFASRHQPDGAWLYGMEVCVDPEFRRMRIGQRLYRARRHLCKELGLRGIIFGGRLPGLKRRMKRFGSAAAYVEAVQAGDARDNTLNFQLRTGFSVVGVLPQYLPADQESLGYAVQLMWRNPDRVEDSPARTSDANHQLPDVVRVASVQYQQRRIGTFEEFATQIEYFVDVAADYHADFVVFPELITLQLLSVANDPLPPEKSIARLSEHTAEVKSLFSRLAMAYNINIIAGSHPTRMDDGDIHNICHICLRDGSIHTQEKLHPTPNERHWWNIKGGDSARAIQTDCGPIGVMICYDAEFPEVARHLIDQGALILFVPFCTDERQSYLRVRYCAQARAVENQCYVVLSGNVGNLPGVINFDIQYAQSCIITPCDFPFARDGIAADSTPNTETVLFADLRPDSLIRARSTGTVQNLRDRRFDLYQTRWPRRREPT